MKRTAFAALVAALPLILPAAAQAAEVVAHLASYRSQAAAENGWRVLADKYSSVLYTKADVRIVQLGPKGQWWRLYAVGDQHIVRMLCDSMRQRKLYCQLHDGESLTPVR